MKWILIYLISSAIFSFFAYVFLKESLLSGKTQIAEIVLYGSLMGFVGVFIAFIIFRMQLLG
jgi:uncharacterized membrane protein YsdA (DUF1294 family)